MRNIFLINTKFMIKERIQALIQALGISGREFCKSGGMSDSWDRLIKKTISIDAASNILRTYPSVNINWLILGEGEMFIDINQGVVKENPSKLYFNKNYEAICEELRLDNKDLREENKKLRESLLELMYKNEKLMVENAQLLAKSLEQK